MATEWSKKVKLSVQPGIGPNTVQRHDDIFAIDLASALLGDLLLSVFVSVCLSVSVCVCLSAETVKNASAFRPLIKLGDFWRDDTLLRGLPNVGSRLRFPKILLLNWRFSVERFTRWHH